MAKSQGQIGGRGVVLGVITWDQSLARSLAIDQFQTFNQDMTVIIDSAVGHSTVL